MAIDGFFFDGMSSARHQVWLALDPGSKTLLLHGRDGMISDLAERWMREGVPGELLVDIGRRVPRR